MNTSRNNRLGVTIVDVVMFLAMGGLLVGAFVPTIGRARQQSRIATCLANMRIIAQGANGYVGENGTIVFTWPRGYDAGEYVPPFTYRTEFIWGGGVPDVTRFSWQYLWGFNPVDTTDVYCYRPALRPLNDYLVPGVWWDDPLRIKGHRERYQIPMEIPDFFKCPSDSTPQLPNAGAYVSVDVPEDSLLAPEPTEVFPTWRYWGTSYACNWYWADHYEGGLLSILGGNANTGDPGLGPALFEQKFQRGASEFVLFMENRLNYALQSVTLRGRTGADQRRGRRGWHGEFDMHVAAFADGSARYRFFDIRYVDSPGWTIWPNRPWDDRWQQFEGN